METLPRCRGGLSLPILALLVISQQLPLVAQQVVTKPAVAKPAVTQPVGDPGWPRSYDLADGGGIVLYQPQVESWPDQRHMVLWSAVSYDMPMATKPQLGTIKIEANTKVSVEDRLVSFADFQITEIHFSSLSRDQSEQLLSGIKQAVPDSDRVIGLDRVLAGVDKSTIGVKNTEGLKADAPKLFHSEKPAILVNLDGAPVWSPITGVDLKFAVNTNWDLLQEASSDSVYLRNDSTWLKAGTVEGPWVAAGKLPETFAKLPDDSSWNAVRANVPGRQVRTPPVVFVSTEPAELLLLKGPPAYTAVKGTSLLWVSNSESDIFRLGKTGAFYYLVAGRWFSAPSLDGPWTFATPELPADFKKIPVDHPRSRVLASVPGTDQAVEAVLLASIPTTARVDKKQVKAPEVVYQGDPQFDSIPGTSVARAVNTDKDIIKVGDLYYMCFQAVWFMSKAPAGPWEVATSIPASIYQIPPSSPSYNVTYVTVVDYDPAEEYVTYAYVPAYTGVMVAWGCVVYGSGWYYPPYVWYGPRPIYYPFPPTYGFGAWYNPYTGAYGRGAAIYGPYGGAGYAASYNPRTGTYARGAAVYGPYNSRAAGQAYNPRTGTYAATRQGSNIYGNWGSSYVQRGDQWAQTAHRTDYRTGTTVSGARTSEGGAAVRREGPNGSGSVVKTGSGDMYAGHDGNVYKKGENGWEQAGGGNASPKDRPAASSPSASTLDKDRAARTEGERRSQDVSSYNAGGGNRSSAGSYRAPRSGGGARRR